jgi:hypothetical protein
MLDSNRERYGRQGTSRNPVQPYSRFLLLLSLDDIYDLERLHKRKRLEYSFRMSLDLQ